MKLKKKEDIYHISIKVGEGLGYTCVWWECGGSCALGWRGLIYSKQQLQCGYNVRLRPRGEAGSDGYGLGVRKKKITVWDRAR